MNQIELHKTIEEVLVKGSGSTETSQIFSLINANGDARQYFFSKADGSWLGWLWENGFLDAIKEKAPDPNSYGFRMPELNYLFSVTEKKPDVVANIICSFEISVKNFNPEVVDQFTRIASKLPARCLKKVVKKIRDEKWVRLMGNYTQYGFEYKDMLKTLHEEGDFENILILSEAILLVRSKEDIKGRKISYRGDDVFYIHDLSDTNVFTYLAEMPEKFVEKALSVTTKIFIEVIKKEGDYLLIDEDLFTLRLSSVVGHEYREELKFLTATIIELVRKIFLDKAFDTKKIYAKYFAGLPKNQVTRRLNLFVLCLNPKLFIKELRVEYFRLFEVKKALEVLYGAEYERALKSGFSLLTSNQKRDYIKKVFDLFTKSGDEDDKRWKRHYASCILSTVSGDLTENEVALAEKNEFKIDPNYQPEPSIGHVHGGTVTPQSPISSDDFSKLSISDIANRLKGELSPQELQKRYKNEDFLNPRDADGVSEQLKSDVKNRLDDYLGNATLFFDRDKLIPHYTNAFLRGIKDTLSENRSNIVDMNYEELFKLLLTIKKSGEAKSFGKTDKGTEGRWLSNWNSVHSTIADLIEELIKQKDKKTLLDFKLYREQTFEALKYLLSYDDPIPEDEKLKTAKMTIKHPSESEASISDPFSIAINSVRGRTFQTLLHFVYQDASNNEKTKLSGDIKDLYDTMLKKENTRAIMFMFGHYLPSFYFRDISWIREKINDIFAGRDKDKYLHLAAWEGYLSSDLYRELFVEPKMQSLYKRNITLKLEYPKQKFFKDPSESIAIHLALAFVHYEDFGLNSDLIKDFLKEASSEQLSEFINFIGRSFIIGENDNILKDKKYPWRIQRLKDFWELMLKNKTEKKALEKFSNWINTGKKIFDVGWLAEKVNQTLAITDGKMEWNYGLTQSIEDFAKEAPDNTLQIIEKYFLSIINSEKSFFSIYEDKEWYRTFEVLYGSEDMEIQGKTYNLINKLLEKGGKPFWILAEIVKK